MRRDALPCRYSLGHLIMINAVVCGLELAASVAYTYLPPLLLKAGFCSASTGFILGIGPLIAMITVPFLGRLADKSRCSLGRRRPLIFVFACVLSTSLIIIIVGQRLIKSAGEEGSYSAVGAGLIMLGGILLDYSSQSAFNPCEALLSDLLEGGPRVTLDTGFAVYSGLLSLGGCLGYMVTAVRWPRPLSGSLLGGQEGAACGVALTIFIATVFATGVAAKEEPRGGAVSLSPIRPPKKEGNYFNFSFPRNQCCRAGLAILRTLVFPVGKLLYVILGKLVLFPRDIYREVKSSPLVLQRLFAADVVSWSAITCYNLFYTNYVGQVVYGGNPTSGVGTLHEALYNEGVRMGSWGLLLHSITACGYASLLQDQMIRNYGLRWTYLCGLLTFSACMVGILFSNDINLLNLFAAFSGVFFFDIREQRGSGADFAVLDIAYYLGQILLSLVMSNVGQILGKPECYMVFAAIAGLTSCYFANEVIYSSSQLITLKGYS
ncbi:hypothetical protein J437_LFUL002758 [Ladona fulva]|uniref:Solute carrier family 45 member 3 n=1 Tax=Ladona fulva TaxID=123851 RepID=A0A8K0JUL6_LADFU|nr:hypothetical protein J437_LFUL002758 [Ladona fulva]